MLYRVPHTRILYRIDKNWIRGPVLQWIQYFLENRSQQVVIEGQESCSIYQGYIRCSPKELFYFHYYFYATLMVSLAK